MRRARNSSEPGQVLGLGHALFSKVGGVWLRFGKNRDLRVCRLQELRWQQRRLSWHSRRKQRHRVVQGRIWQDFAELQHKNPNPVLSYERRWPLERCAPVLLQTKTDNGIVDMLVSDLQL